MSQARVTDWLPGASATKQPIAHLAGGLSVILGGIEDSQRQSLSLTQILLRVMFDNPNI